MEEVASETAHQLFARLSTRSNIQEIETRLFTKTQSTATINCIEFFGKDSVGKTEILLHIIIKTILPKAWKGFNLDGKESCILLIDMDNKFPFTRLLLLLEKQYLKHKKLKKLEEEAKSVDSTVSSIKYKKLEGEESKSVDSIVSSMHVPRMEDTIKSTDIENNEREKLCKFEGGPRKQTCMEETIKSTDIEDTEQFIKSCLERFFKLTCTSSLTFLVTLHSLEGFLKDNADCTLLLIDNINSFYWIDRVASTNYSNYTKQTQIIIKLLKSLIDNFNIMVVLTRLVNLDANKNDSRKQYSFLNEIIQQRYQLQKGYSKNGEVQFSSKLLASNSKNVYFEITDNGVVFN